VKASDVRILFEKEEEEKWQEASAEVAITNSRKPQQK
jgi:putative AlgH/UPF0301 family transcriptional regulator